MCRIITYNIHSGVGQDKKHDYRRIGNYLAAQNADIVLLQEMDTRSDIRDTQTDINNICAGKVFELVASPAVFTKWGWYGNAVLSRYPIISNRTLDVSYQGVEPRNIQTVEVATPRGPLTVINTHKGLKKRERRSQFAQLHDYIGEIQQHASAPILLGGDFNEWQFFTHAFRSIDKVLAQHKVGATFPSRFPLFSLDRVWTSSDIQVKRVKKLKNSQTKTLSDHLPVLVDIALP
ncbi:endonuclease/exonuclease/phosphatase family protein [Alteromonas sp. C1M14]|uniref:endonuclease/exonuclease/phosphatase family protein n=1 Tax=Alteromonas sp. C1M14 TaxID=2841567 RepID=UPI001C0A2827|nr:endonuclease/exonuclease/phosphatase family protein [Alteromonas sp. C1M14]MBU2979675.1 endonuclease/exonuclease/phosphatase family protein [Alteromonas sp. C1M14]